MSLDAKLFRGKIRGLSAQGKEGLQVKDIKKITVILVKVCIFIVAIKSKFGQVKKTCGQVSFCVFFFLFCLIVSASLA